jgi:hypothetical protein
MEQQAKLMGAHPRMRLEFSELNVFKDQYASPSISRKEYLPCTE